MTLLVGSEQLRWGLVSVNPLLELYPWVLYFPKLSLAVFPGHLDVNYCAQLQG